MENVNRASDVESQAENDRRPRGGSSQTTDGLVAFCGFCGSPIPTSDDFDELDLVQLKLPIPASEFDAVDDSDEEFQSKIIGIRILEVSL